MATKLRTVLLESPAVRGREGEKDEDEKQATEGEVGVACVAADVVARKVPMSPVNSVLRVKRWTSHAVASTVSSASVAGSRCSSRK